MVRFSASLWGLFRELPVIERIGAAGMAGFGGVEIHYPYEYAPELIGEKLEEHEVKLALINTPWGDWDAGDRGMACCAGREEEFRGTIELALDYAVRLGRPLIHVVAGLTKAGLCEPSWDTYVANLTMAAKMAEDQGCQLLIEPINQRDMDFGFWILDFGFSDSNGICSSQ
ncbi:MAG: TIM barrel protein [Ardenticatenaceae bacterium]